MDTRLLRTGLGVVAIGLVVTWVAPAEAATVASTVVDNAFQPAAITLTEGDTVVWTHNGQRPHTVTADDGSFNSGTLSNGQTFSRTYSSPGTFRYFCSFHGAAGGIGMSGVVTVVAQVTTTTTTAPPTTTTTNPTAASAPSTAATTATTARPVTATTRVAARSVAVATTTAAVAPVQPPGLARTGSPSSLALLLIGLGLVVTGIGCVRRSGEGGGAG